MVRKICIVTGSRAEYGLLRPLMTEIAADAALRLQLIVTGMHLAPEFGATYREIEADGFVADAKIAMLESDDSLLAMARATGCGLMGLAEAMTHLGPDLVLVFGDRFEMLAAASAALLLRLPIAHIAGGQITEGAVDDSIRHAITKMAHLHFTATRGYADRILQMGERPEYVHVVGSTGLDAIAREKLMSRAELMSSLGFKLGAKNLLVTFHPATLDDEAPEIQLDKVLAALNAFPDIRLIFTFPNADAGGRALARRIEEYVTTNSARSKAFASPGHLRYVSTLAQVDGVVGNSSSGLIEAPSFKIGTVNIGDRQKGRERAASVIDCACDTNAIILAIETLYSSAFRAKLSQVVNPFGDGRASLRIKEVLKSQPLAGLIRKSFRNLPIAELTRRS